MLWKDVLGFEGLYQVSSCGKVRSLDRIVTQKNKPGYKPITRIYKGRILKANVDNGYLKLSLSNRKINKTIRIHVIVAETFCNGWFEGAVVNHKDGNKLNNDYLNLEWVTIAENNIHAYKSGLKNSCLEVGINATMSKWIISVFKNDVHIIDVCGVKEFNEFGNPLGLKYSSMLNYFRGTVKQYKGYTFTRRLK